jgi:hypothetical protein
MVTRGLGHEAACLVVDDLIESRPGQLLNIGGSSKSDHHFPYRKSVELCYVQSTSDVRRQIKIWKVQDLDHSVVPWRDAGGDGWSLQALESNGQVLGDFPLRVLPSKTAIVPVNTQYLPKTTTEREKCSRTIYAANIDKKVDRDSVKLFFETLCGRVPFSTLLNYGQSFALPCGTAKVLEAGFLKSNKSLNWRVSTDALSYNKIPFLIQNKSLQWLDF